MLPEPSTKGKSFKTGGMQDAQFLIPAVTKKLLSKQQRGLQVAQTCNSPITYVRCTVHAVTLISTQAIRLTD